MELVRKLAGHSQLLCVVPPLAGAIASGLLKAELGRNGSLALQYTSPYQILTSNLRDVRTLEKPPLWYEDSTLSPPRLPTPEELAELLHWWNREKTSNQRGSTTAALGAGSGAVLPPGQRRSGNPPDRLLEET